MKRSLSIKFIRHNLNSILDVDLNSLCQLLKQQGFEFVGAYMTEEYTDVVSPLVLGDSPTAPPPPAPAPADASDKPKRERKAKDPETTAAPPPAATTEPAAETAAEPELPKIQNGPRNEAGAIGEKDLRALLTPIANAGHGAVVNEFIAAQGYERLSQIPDHDMHRVLTAARMHKWPEAAALS